MGFGCKSQVGHLWSRKELLEKLFAHYDKLPKEMRLALPLKRVWMVASQELD